MVAKTFVLTFVKDGKVKVIAQRELIQDLQRVKSEVKKDPIYRNGLFQIRTPDGLKAVPILEKKFKR